eukprot:13120.XXX_98632_94413_1 [CDS] Oithona nana genome sequencing.
MPPSNRYSKNPWNSFLGDCSVIDQYLLDKPILSLKWFIPHYLNVLLRAIGQPAFVNNPLCGLLILIATFLPDWRVGLGMVLGGSIATIGEMVLRLQPWELMRNGVAAFNGVLVGTVISSLYPTVYNVEMDLKMWIFICLGAITSIFVCSAFVNTLGAGNNIPYLALPFNLIAVCTFLTIQPQVEDHQENTTEDTFNSTLPEMEDINWCQVGRGIAVSMGQVYAINDVPASSIMNLAVFLASPLLFIMSTIGAVLGSLAGVLILPTENLQEVYDGIWGYNAVIATASISCVFFAFSSMSFTLGMINLLATIGAQYALRATMVLQSNIPVFTMPMTLVTLVLINVTDKRGLLYRVEDMSYPEKQAYEWHTRTKVETNPNLAVAEDVEKI